MVIKQMMDHVGSNQQNNCAVTVKMNIFINLNNILSTKALHKQLIFIYRKNKQISQAKKIFIMFWILSLGC